MERDAKTKPLEGFTPYQKQDAEKYSKFRWWMGLTWGDLLDKAADLYPNKVALADDTSRLTYAGLREKANRLGVSLIKMGIKQADRVLLQIPNWNEFVYAFFALQKIGAIPVLVLSRHSQLEINHFASLTEARAWIVPESYKKINYLPIINDVLKSNPQIEFVFSVRGRSDDQFIGLEKLTEGADLTEANLRELAGRRPDPMAVAQLIPTGGTTGLPKLVARTHNDHICQVEYRARASEITSEDTLLVIGPVAHGQGIVSGMGASIFTFAKLVLASFAGIDDLCKVIEREKVTTIPTVPSIPIMLTNYEGRSKYDMSSLKKVLVGGAPSTPQLVKSVIDKLGCKFLNNYGSVEGLSTTTRPDDDLDVICNTVGKICCPYVTVKVIDQEENELPLNTEGQLVAKGPHVITGYFKSTEEERKQTFTKDGFLKTGDLGTIDAAGNVKITGRIKDIIIRGGENISATDIEQLISTHVGVRDVAVVGMPDEVLGERICAYIQPKPGAKLTFEEVISFLKDKGASVLQLPERIEFVQQMPLTQVGKPDKRALREDIKRRIGWAE